MILVDPTVTFSARETTEQDGYIEAVILLENIGNDLTSLKFCTVTATFDGKTIPISFKGFAHFVVGGDRDRISVNFEPILIPPGCAVFVKPRFEVKTNQLRASVYFQEKSRITVALSFTRHKDLVIGIDNPVSSVTKNRGASVIPRR